jgi:hypothetical protein
MIGVMPGNIVVDRRFPSALYGEAKVLSVCFIVKPVGEPDVGNPHVRFDERGWETGRLRCRYRAHPRLYPRLDALRVLPEGRGFTGCGETLPCCHPESSVVILSPPFVLADEPAILIGGLLCPLRINCAKDLALGLYGSPCTSFRSKRQFIGILGAGSVFG